MMTRNITVDRRAYSISPVALKAIAIREARRNALLSKSFPSLSGILMALGANNPRYKMMRERMSGCVLIKTSAGFVSGLKRFLTPVVILLYYTYRKKYRPKVGICCVYLTKLQ